MLFLMCLPDVDAGRRWSSVQKKRSIQEDKQKLLRTPTVWLMCDTAKLETWSGIEFKKYSIILLAKSQQNVLFISFSNRSITKTTASYWILLVNAHRSVCHEIPNLRFQWMSLKPNQQYCANQFGKGWQAAYGVSTCAIVNEACTRRPLTSAVNVRSLCSVSNKLTRHKLRVLLIQTWLAQNDRFCFKKIHRERRSDLSPAYSVARLNVWYSKILCCVGLWTAISFEGPLSLAFHEETDWKCSSSLYHRTLSF